jgi:hypothetical protein
MPQTLAPDYKWMALLLGTATTGSINFRTRANDCPNIPVISEPKFSSDLLFF